MWHPFTTRDGTVVVDRAAGSSLLGILRRRRATLSRLRALPSCDQEDDVFIFIFIFIFITFYYR